MPPRIRQRHRPRSARPKHTYLREDRILPHLAALAILLAGEGTPDHARQAGITAPAQTADLIDQPRVTGTVLTYDPDTRTIRAGDDTTVAVTVGQRN
jgi:site-specific DNA recombinase